MHRVFELCDVGEGAAHVFCDLVRRFFVFLLDKFVDDPALVLALGLVHFADELPNFSPQAFALNRFESLIETLSDPQVTQMFNLEAKVGLYPVACFDFLDRVHQDGHPFVLGVRARDVQLVDRSVQYVVLHHRSGMLTQAPVALAQLFEVVLLQSGLVRQRTV